MNDLKLRLGQSQGLILAIVVFFLMFTLYIANHPAGLTVPVVTTAANKAVLLALVAMAQTLPVLTGGLDLSVGMVFIMTNCLASSMVSGDPLQIAIGTAVVLLAGALAGLVNGVIVVYGRLQPIITTLATGAVYYGIALLLRPVPGGDVDEDLADFMTYTVFEVVPTSLVVLLAAVLIIWLPFRNSVVGRGCYAVGSAEGAAYMTGVAIGRSKLAAYTLAGLLAGLAGLMLTFVTFSGEASAPIGGTYTLNSIAAVVIGGTSLYGGAGGAIGSIFGAFILRTIDDLLFVFDLPPLWQPLFQGVVLLVAVSLGAARVFRIRNRLELFK
ncbi:MAG TPA: ABC transporter permease [Kiloniellaceae bacterium]|nr:ABC transporter permease [Kiloniellaceae bacterium]